MTKTGHQLTGLGAALAAIGGMAFWFPSTNFLSVGILTFFGSTAPDWLEIPQGWTGTRRLSVIPHRTWTHWWPFWVAATVWASGFWTGSAHPLWLSFCVGAWWHLAMDLPNPMGLPVWSPFQRRSMNWWRGSEHVLQLTVASWGLGAALFALPGLLFLFR